MAAAAAAELAPGWAPPEAQASHFFVAVCAAAPQTGSPLYVYLPSSANALKEREDHIRKLEGELGQKDAWLEELKQAHARLHEEHEKTLAEMRLQTEWAQRLEGELGEARQRILELQGELEEQQRAAQEAVEGYEAQIRRLQQTLEELAAEHKAKIEELAHCVKLLDEAEARVVERTEWAQALDARVRELEAALGMVQASRWVRLGRKLGVGPRIG
jgi:chromosome segregation ATPase